MMPHLVALIGALSMTEPTDEGITRIAAALDRCGVAVTAGSINYDDMIQGYMAVVPGPGTTRHSLECFAASELALGVHLEFEDVEQRDVYDGAIQRRPEIIAGLASLRASQEDWLKERGLADGLPRYHPGGRPQGLRRGAGAALWSRAWHSVRGSRGEVRHAATERLTRCGPLLHGPDVYRPTRGWSAAVHSCRGRRSLGL